METKKVITAIIFIFLAAAVSAQPIIENRKGNIRTQGNIAGGYLFSQKKGSAYFGGDLDLFVDNKVSIVGEAWYGFKLKNVKTGLLNNHAVYWGFNYHPVKRGRFDPYFGISPGLGIAQIGYRDPEGIVHETVGLAPLLSGTAGINYYIGSIFHFFVKVRGTAGRTRADSSPESTKLHDIKLTAGLGWNLRLWKAKVN